MKSILKFFKGNQHKPPNISAPKNKKNCCDLLTVPDVALKVGDNVEVHYLDAGLPQIEIARVGAVPNRNSFYLTFDGSDLHITYWHQKHSDGRISGVKMIKSGGRVLYENGDIPFNYESESTKASRTQADGPARLMTREYLSGKFG